MHQRVKSSKYQIRRKAKQEKRESKKDALRRHTHTIGVTKGKKKKKNDK